MCFDDLYTPGSFWLNPCQPRDAAGKRCDPDAGPLVGATKASLEDEPCAEDATAVGRAEGSGLAGPADVRETKKEDVEEDQEDSVLRILGDMTPAPVRRRRQ